MGMSCRCRIEIGSTAANSPVSRPRGLRNEAIAGAAAPINYPSTAHLPSSIFHLSFPSLRLPLYTDSRTSAFPCSIFAMGRRIDIELYLRIYDTCSMRSGIGPTSGQARGDTSRSSPSVAANFSILFHLRPGFGSLMAPMYILK